LLSAFSLWVVAGFLIASSSLRINKILKGIVIPKYKHFVENCLKLLPRQALHAKILGFTHPKTGKFVYFESELPNDMTAVLEKWRLYVEARKEASE
jgi:23S rRNA pseudouridine1911/1915/1917 synthase